VTQRLEEGALETVVPSLGTNEVGDLARAIERMRAALAARDTQTQMLLAGIAHEVRNPLSGMELFVGLLEEDLREDTAAHDKVERVRRELDYLKRVVEEFLAYSRNVRASTVRFAGRELLLEVAESCSCAAQSAGVRVVVQPAQLELTADREMLRGAVANVVLNAIQASSSGSVVRLELQQEGSFRAVEVVDTGRGMSAEVLARANQPFFTTREKGTGLGLALAQKVAERHGGRLAVASTEGVGTTVRFSLPFDLAVPLAVEDAATSLGPDWIG
jgi:signal transduction histidine kinase